MKPYAHNPWTPNMRAAVVSLARGGELHAGLPTKQRLVKYQLAAWAPDGKMVLTDLGREKLCRDCGGFGEVAPVDGALHTRCSRCRGTGLERGAR